MINGLCVGRIPSLWAPSKLFANHVLYRAVRRKGCGHPIGPHGPIERPVASSGDVRSHCATSMFPSAARRILRCGRTLPSSPNLADSRSAWTSTTKMRKRVYQTRFGRRHANDTNRMPQPSPKIPLGSRPRVATCPMVLPLRRTPSP